MAAQKIHSSTQKFTQIVDIVDTVVVLEGGYACMVIEITATNFALLSRQEQDAKIFSYASLLNSLSFPIQILIRNKRVDITSYLKALDEATLSTKNTLLKQQIALYKDFINQLVTVNVILNKNFYIIISYSSLEGGIGAVAAGSKGTGTNNNFIDAAKKTLTSKADNLRGQITQIAANVRILEKDDLIRLFYDIYNGELINASTVAEDIRSTIITANTTK